MRDSAVSPYPLGVVKVLAIILIGGGALGLAYRGFDYTKDSHTTKVGPLEFTMNDREHVVIPVWAGVIAIALGTGLAFVPVRRR